MISAWSRRLQTEILCYKQMQMYNFKDNAILQLRTSHEMMPSIAESVCFQRAKKMRMNGTKALCNGISVGTLGGWNTVAADRI